MASSRIKITHVKVSLVKTLVDLPGFHVWDGVTADVDGVINMYASTLGMEAYVFYAKGPGVEERESGLLLVAARAPIVLQTVCNDVNSEAIVLATEHAMLTLLANTYKYIIVYDDAYRPWENYGYRSLPSMHDENGNPNCWCAGIDPKETVDTLRGLRFTLPVKRPHVYPAREARSKGGKLNR